MTAESILFHMIRVAVCGEKMDISIMDKCTPEMLESVYNLACRHDLAHLVGCVLENAGFSEDTRYVAYKTAKNRAIYRYVKMDYEYEQICNLFEKEKIPFIPLKGAVLRKYYPAPWMRTSCDIDILVSQDNLNTAVGCLEEKLNYKYSGKYLHDISMCAPSGMHLELHFSTIEEFVSKQMEQTLAGIWEDAKPAGDYSYQQEISDSLFYYYHMAHMAKHIINGGCGIRPFLDVWILNHRINFDKAKRDARLEKGGLTAFARVAEKLSEVWFSGRDADDSSECLAHYILSGGTYGSLKNRVQIRQSRRGGTVRYMLSRVFMPYHDLKYYYPIIQKYKILTPIFEVVRWFRIIFAGRVRDSVQELQTNAAITQDDKEAAQALLEELGLGFHN